MQTSEDSSFDAEVGSIASDRADLQSSVRVADTRGAEADLVALEQRHDALIRRIVTLVRDAASDRERGIAMGELMRALEDRLVDLRNFSLEPSSRLAKLGELTIEYLDAVGNSGDLRMTTLERTYYRAIGAMYAGRSGEAAVGLRAACESEESDEANDIKFKAYVILGNLSHGEKDFDAAKALHERSLQYAREGNVSAQALAFKALNAYAVGDQDEALALFTRALQLFSPDQPFYNSYFHRNALLFSGSIHYERKAWPDAENAYRAAIEHLEPESFDRYDALAQLGRVCYSTGRWDEAVDMFRQALQIEAAGQTEYHLDTRFWLARAHVKQGNIRDAREMLQQVIESETPYERRPQAEALLARCS